MTLHLIGIGLAEEKDISVKGLEAVKKSEIIYLENYTSLLQCTQEDLEKFYGKKITLLSRKACEEDVEKIITEAQIKEVAFLIIGDPFSATTHIELFRSAKEKNIPIHIIHNASVLTAIGETGLQLYNFGKITSIPFPEKVPNLETPYIVLQQNLSLGMHTLFLLDLDPEKNKFLTIPEAIQTLEDIESRKKENFITPKTFAVACARLGSRTALIKAGTLLELKKIDFGKPPYCLIIPGKLHFLEEEMLRLYQ
ncbi:diphthine synthase [Candidatus Woesearchaeota archaeon]|nr:diphthine synthase [Candidatus Woesearchaeota archaeon]